MNFPFKPGSNKDRGNFMEYGQRDELKQIGKKSLCDKIYNAHPN